VSRQGQKDGRMVRPRKRGSARPRHRVRMHGERGVSRAIGGGEAVAIKAAAAVGAMAAPARIQSARDRSRALAVVRANTSLVLSRLARSPSHQKLLDGGS
jgi:hypothetical protein